jgi:hypothetical protein
MQSVAPDIAFRLHMARRFRMLRTNGTQPSSHEAEAFTTVKWRRGNVQCYQSSFCVARGTA